MFLFTTPTSMGAATGARPSGGAAAQKPEILDAIRDGSQRTGTGFDYLVRTAQRESSLNPTAKAPTSSASGLFQFIEQTWLGTVKTTGATHGLGDYAAAITQGRDGRFDVSDPRVKTKILELRQDPTVAALMAGELTRQNAATLGSAIGRAPTQGELYAAHVMGAAGAADLIRQARAKPAASAADLYPEQAQANRGIFFEGARARSLAEVYQTLTAGPAAAAPNAASGVPAVSSDPSSWFMRQAMPLAYAQTDGPAMHALFRTEGRRGPLNQAVERLWSPRSAKPNEGSPPSFFPKGDGVSMAVDAPSRANPAPAAHPEAVPLPPPRPADLGKTSQAPRARDHAGGPLDLRRYASASLGT